MNQTDLAYLPIAELRKMSTQEIRQVQIDAEIDAEIDESLTLEDLLFICGHRALGLSIRQALEINRHYGHEVDRPL